MVPNHGPSAPQALLSLRPRTVQPLAAWVFHVPPANMNPIRPLRHPSHRAIELPGGSGRMQTRCGEVPIMRPQHVTGQVITSTQSCGAARICKIHVQFLQFLVPNGSNCIPYVCGMVVRHTIKPASKVYQQTRPLYEWRWFRKLRSLAVCAEWRRALWAAGRQRTVATQVS